jgi:hypothetical protein
MINKQKIKHCKKQKKIDTQSENAKPYFTMHKRTKNEKIERLLNFFDNKKKRTWKKIVEDDDFNKAMYLQK